MIQGMNGQGKSTLAKLLLGQLEPTHGDVRRHANSAAYFHQDALLDLVQKYGKVSPVAFLRGKDVHLSDTEARSYLGRFGLKGNLSLRPIRTLSAGQRVGLWLSREFYSSKKDYRKPSLLLLDEVTENLDHETTDSLLESLSGFSAALVAISHDDYFCQRFQATQVWHVAQHRVFVQFQ